MWRPYCLLSIIGKSAHNERKNIEVVYKICEILDELYPPKKLITFVEDRPGNDKRYALDATKIMTELNWKPKESFESGLRETVKWYIENPWLWKPLHMKYDRRRLGLLK